MRRTSIRSIGLSKVGIIPNDNDYCDSDDDDSDEMLTDYFISLFYPPSIRYMQATRI